ncbi:MAG: WD40 repeat domain-containing protein, partial [Myxococcota bacterium]
GTARRWDAATGVPRWTNIGHEDGIWRASYSPDGRRLLTAGFDGTARVWDATVTHEQASWSGQDRAVRGAALSPDGTRMAAVDDRGTVRVWQRGGPLSAEFAIGAGQSRLVWSPDGAHLLSSQGAITAAGTDLGQVADATVWDARTGERLLVLAAHEGRIFSAEYDDRGQRIITASADRTAKIWDARDGRLLATLAGHSDGVTHAAFSPDGTRVVTASRDQSARLWEPTTGQALSVLLGHSLYVNWARFSSDGQAVVTAADDKTARVWNTAGALLITLEGDSALQTAEFHPDGQLIATASAAGTVGLWGAEDGQLLWSLDLRGRAARSPIENKVRALQFYRGGDVLLAAAGRSAALYPISYSERRIERRTEFVRCRVGYTLERGRLKRATIDHQHCRGQR